MPTVRSFEVTDLYVSTTPVDGEDDVVIRIDYIRVARDPVSGASVRDAGVFEFDLGDLQGPFTPFANLTENNVRGWLTANIASGRLRAVDTNLDAQLSAATNPPLKKKRLPWAVAE